MRAALKTAMAGALYVCATFGIQAQQSEPQVPDAPVAVAQTTAAPAAQQTQVVFHKKVFWTLAGVDAASAVADVQTSWHNEQTYPAGSEQNSWLYGKKPSLGRYYATCAVMDGGGSLLSYRMLHSRRRLLRAAGWALLGGLIAQHTEGWSYNVSVR